MTSSHNFCPSARACGESVCSATSSKAAVVRSGDIYLGLVPVCGEFSRFDDLNFGALFGNVLIAAFSDTYADPIGQLSGLDSQSATGISLPGL